MTISMFLELSDFSSGTEIAKFDTDTKDFRVIMTEKQWKAFGRPTTITVSITTEEGQA